MKRYRMCKWDASSMMAWATAICVMGIPSMVHAEPMPQTTERARALYEAGVRELDARGPARACPMFEEATSLAPESWGSWMMLGDCRQREGRLATAYRAYTTAAEVAAKLGHTARAQQSTRKAVALETKVAKLVIELSDDVRMTPELEVLVDGKPVTISGSTTRLPVDRGEHTIVVKGKGKTPVERTRSLLVDGTQASVNIDRLLAAPPSETRTQVIVTHKKKTFSLPEVPKWQRKAAWITASVGAASIVGGSVAGIIAISRKNESNDGHCVGNECDREGVALRKGSLQAGSISTGMFVAGGILAAASVTLAFVPLTKKKTMGLQVGPTQVGLHMAF